MCVPQETVLASLIFLIWSRIKTTISWTVYLDILQMIKKISVKIKTEEDIELLQQDFNKVYEWADENLMEFNKNKFKQISHGVKGNNRPGKYKTK